MSKNLLGFLVVASLFFCFIWWDSYRGSKEFPKEIKQRVFNGVFVRAFEDNTKRGILTVVLDDSSKEDFRPYSSALKNINPGDTLIKLRNTLKLVVKNGTKKEVFYPSYFGETFYDSTVR